MSQVRDRMGNTQVRNRIQASNQDEETGSVFKELGKGAEENAGELGQPRWQSGNERENLELSTQD